MAPNPIRTPAPVPARLAVPPGIPDGWYFLRRSGALAAGVVAAVRLGGEDRVLWRHHGGAVHLQSAWCPHLGAHLGHGGTVHGDRIRCPFHGFEFDGAGACVATGYGTRPPPRAELSTLPTMERDGLIFGWHGARPPGWMPDIAPSEGWSPFALRHWELRGHPQETTENSVDVGHFAWVHGYRDVETVEPMRVDGPHLTARYRFGKPVMGAFAPEEIALSVWGLGYSRVEVSDRLVGARFRLLVLPSPIEADRIRLTIALAIQDPSLAEATPWRFLPRWVARHVVAPLVLRNYASDVEADFVVWNHKSWLSRPALAEGDGPIGAYRAWAAQFYPEVPCPPL